MARYLVNVGRWLRDAEMRVRPAEINGQPGAITFANDGRILNVVALDIAEGHVQTVRGILNPDKLRHLGPVADVARLVRNDRPDQGHTQ